MKNREEDTYLVIGVEDGWIKVDKYIWQDYLEAKKRILEDGVKYENKNL